jgi:hypothetical protein
VFFVLTPLQTQQDECTINPMLSVLYFSIFMLVCAYIMIQLVIGIVLDNIQAASLMEDMAIGQVGCSISVCVFVCVCVFRRLL